MANYNLSNIRLIGILNFTFAKRNIQLNCSITLLIKFFKFFFHMICNLHTLHFRSLSLSLLIAYFVIITTQKLCAMKKVWSVRQRQDANFFHSFAVFKVLHYVTRVKWLFLICVVALSSLLTT